MSNLLLSVSSIATSILYILLAIVVLLFMIMIHELGHYTAGKLLKFKINEFSIGFGKAIYSKTKKNGEKFSIRIFPLGGYCAFEGEDEDKPGEVGAFNSQKPWKRLIVLFMGAFFNFLSAIIFAVIFLMAFGYNDRVQVTNVELPQNYTQSADTWLMEGDVIHAVNGKETNFVYDEYFITLVSDFNVDENFVVSVYRDGKDIDLTIHKSWFNCSSKSSEIETKTPLFTLDGKNYDYACMLVPISAEEIQASIDRGENYKFIDIAGQNYCLKFYNTKLDTIKTYTVQNDDFVTIANTTFKVDYSLVSTASDLSSVTIANTKIGVITQNYRYGFFEAIGRSFVFCFGWAWKILIILWQLITGQLALTSMGGTVTTVVTIAQVTQTNIASLLLLIPLISVNLAVFNLLPFPALDGARMVFVLIEMIRKKPVNRKLEGTIHFIGLMILLLFVLLVDILHFVV